MKRKWKLLLALFAAATLQAEGVELASPNGEIRMVISARDGQPSYRVDVSGKPVVLESALGLMVPDAGPAGLTKMDTRTIDETWQPVYGKRSRVRNHCNELVLTLAADAAGTARAGMVFRAYNDGVAFRYTLDGQGKAKVGGEATEFRFHGDPAWWSYQREREPKGPVRGSALKGALSYPVLSTDVSGFSVAITEAHLRDYPWASLNPGFSLQKRDVTVDLPFQGPWRVILIGSTPGVLIDSDLVANLNPRANPEEFAWAKPGIAFWDWRAWGHKAKDGFTYGLDLPSWKRFIDLGAEMGVPYLLLDANWYGNEFSKDSDPFSGGNAAQVKQAIEYGEERGVGLVLYLNDVAAKKYGVEKIIKAYADWGAKGIKYGFMRINDPLQKVKWTHHVVQLCAKNKLFVNFHDGPVPPTGEEVTWPNFMNREFCHAQSDAKRTSLPGAFVKMVHVNMLAGPLDMNHGMFDLDHSHAQRPKMFAELYSTTVAEAARTLITYGGGMTVIPDSADSYRSHPGLFRFIAAQKPPWQESRTLASSMPEYICMMRRARDGTYLVGTANNEEARILKIKLDFLEPGKTYQATIFADNKETHYRTNRQPYVVGKRDVQATDTITARLAPGGGHCMIIETITKGR